MPINEGLMTSSRGDWETPRFLFDCYNSFHNFTLDAAADDDNHLCKEYFAKRDNALTKSWKGRVWLNPPYGRGMKDFIKKALQEGKLKHYDILTMLLPARTDTKWFQALWQQDCGLVVFDFLTGRLKFTINGKEIGTAPFPSMVVTLKTSHPWGRVVNLLAVHSIRAL